MQTFRAPTQTQLMHAAIDISAPVMGVEVQMSEEGDKLWVNVDGVCVLRIQNMRPEQLSGVKPTNGEGQDDAGT